MWHNIAWMNVILQLGEVHRHDKVERDVGCSAPRTPNITLGPGLLHPRRPIPSASALRLLMTTRLLDYSLAT
jgi:hypothetical protein